MRIGGLEFWEYFFFLSLLRGYCLEFEFALRGVSGFASFVYI